jgi:hypothetical protein
MHLVAVVFSKRQKMTFLGANSAQNLSNKKGGFNSAFHCG